MLEALHLPPVSVGAPYFNLTVVPLLLPLVAVMSLVPFLVWGGYRRTALRRRAAALLGLGMLPGVFWLASGGVARLAVLLGLALAGCLLASVLLDIWRQRRAGQLWSCRLWGMWLAHGGLAVAVAGMVATSLAKIETSVWLAPGDSTTFAGHDILFQGVRNVPGPNYQAIGADLLVDGVPMRPEKRFFPVRQMITTEVALQRRGLSDLYLVLGDRRPDGQAWSFLLYYNPWVHLIWWGVVVMAAGGMVAAWRRGRE